jgi:hypothetical protein
MAGGKGRPDESGRDRAFRLIVTPWRAAMDDETKRRIRCAQIVTSILGVV